MHLVHCGISLLVFSVAFGSSQRLSAAASGDKDLLRLVADVHGANTKRIDTWSGHVAITDTSEVNKGELSRIDADVHFFHDALADRLRWAWSVRRREGRTDGAVALLSSGILTDNTLAFLHESEGDNAPIRSIEIVPRTEFSTGPLSTTFSPMYYFGYRGEDVADRFRYFHRHFDESGMDGWSVIREGDVVTMMFDDGEIMNKYVVDLARGGTLSSYEATASLAHGTKPLESEKWEWTYENLREIWVPKTVQYEKRERFEVKNGMPVPTDRERVAMRSLRWVSNKINAPISEEEFDLTKLGIRDGDVVADKLAGTTYRYTSLATQASPNRNVKTYFIAINAIILIIIVCLIARNRLFARGHSGTLG